MLSDIEIAQQADMRPITDVAADVGIEPSELKLYGDHIAKVDLGIRDRLADQEDGKLILVTAITPTPLGEGKTVTTLGLGQAMRYIGENAICAIREPSMGPVFGIKGGACGGGYAQVVPMEDINLHFTGDIHAVGAANNLLAAMIDASLWHGNPLDIDPFSISWNRGVDMNDVALRNMVIGLGGKSGGWPREAQFDITVASEVMAVLALTNGLQDIRERFKRIQVAVDSDGNPVTADDIGAVGAMTALMKDAVKPNLVQGLDGGATLIHAGPFANIAVGTSSIVADQVAMKLGDYAITEAGFGADCGAEKFCNIKCRVAGYQPAAVVIVATIRALKLHGGAFEFKPGRKPPTEKIEKENVGAVREGCKNLAKHIENMGKMGLPTIVAINCFPTDTEAEIEALKEEALAAGATAAVPTHVHAKGGEGGADLAEAVVAAAQQENDFEFLYPDDMSIREKIETICTEIYGAADVEFSTLAKRRIRQFTKEGYDNLPICMAKTHLSLSHDPSLKGRPEGFTVPIRDIRPSLGAGFLYPLCGEMRTMPGLPSFPAALDVDVDEDGEIVGLF
ncbi:MAG: formate--tetrahydrofolate ligase [Armatimonadota bacterium]